MESLKTHLLALGIPGLLLISFLDSAGVPLPGGVDVVVMLLSWQRPSLFVVVAFVAAAGSAAGCFVLYRLARAGGDTMMSRFSVERQEWVKEKVRQNDVLSVLLAMLGPPPFPTKLFVIVAGAMGMDWRRFLLAVFLARWIRFLGEAYLAVRLGEQAIDRLKEHYPAIGLTLVVAVVLILAVRHVAGRRATA